ncbi:trehalose-phosphatase [Rubrivirga sp. S365]|uniref:Trehalose 6-phosphate phosphatase n=1 Tax=Rubrivirga litoralis TaxID=3075598 RepID=A0ABU3BPS7_9BACT|nr:MULTISPECIES: trehalose-phosphatase [unclassified Rubrivirga]MDT0631292.1 trehalose-phosphatase [Rubrivirga sp. F394]MDT7856004.1 trehalose-phosphatase [Rubrivirga sp. S365]
MPPVPPRPLLFLDYDGTLAPIVDDPAAAVPHPDVPDLLARLVDAHPVVVITGRDLAALGRLLGGAGGPRVRAVGLHGVETGWSDGTVEERATEAHGEALDRLRAAVPDAQGVVVEDKGAAFAVHYRAAADPDAARAALEAWAETVPDGLTPIWGKRVVELRPAGVSKGTAVAALAAEHPDRTPVYLGDDVTDEDAFRALQALRQPAVTVKVGEGETVAGHRLPDVDAVVAYLRAFL